MTDEADDLKKRAEKAAIEAAVANAQKAEGETRASPAAWATGLVKLAAEHATFDMLSISKWFTEHFKNRNCPWCNHDTWSLQPHATTLPVSATHGFPCIVLICNECAYTLLFNAVRMGLVKGDPHV
jgi:hypothetical protein